MENTIIRNEKISLRIFYIAYKEDLNPLGYTIYANILIFVIMESLIIEKALITIGCRIPSNCSSFFFRKKCFFKHFKPFSPSSLLMVQRGNSPWITLADAIKHLPSLDARSKTKDENDKYHCVPKWNDQQYFWMQHTPEGESAFDNI